MNPEQFSARTKLKLMILNADEQALNRIIDAIRTVCYEAQRGA